MKSLKKITALLAALAISASMLTACGKTDSSSDGSSASDSASDASAADSSASSADDASSQQSSELPEPTLTIDGESVDINGLVMCKIDGNEISFDLFRYYYYYQLSLFANNYGITLENIMSDETLIKTFKDTLISALKQDLVCVHLAKENGIELDEDDKKKVDSNIEAIKANYASDEEYENALKAACMTPEVYRYLQELSVLYSKVESQLFLNGGKYATSADDFRKIVKDTDKYSRVRSILIPYHCKVDISDESVAAEYESYTLSQKNSAKNTAYNALSDEDKEKAKEEAKKVADEALEKAKNGEDFDKLIDEYGWDPGMVSSKDGYYINKDHTSYIAAYVDAAFALSENEISDLVESESYGWFILKRLPVDDEYVEANLDKMIIEYDDPTITQLYKDVSAAMEVTDSEYFDKMNLNDIT